MSGRHMATEMQQQPEVLRRLFAQREPLVSRLRSALPEDLRGIALVARGSSSNAAVYGRYVLEVASGLPVVMVAPSLHTIHRVRACYDGYLAVAISQSGRTPEILTVLDALVAAGACGIAITNEPDSPLGEAASQAIHLGAGTEQAVPATKTFTAQLAAFCLLADALGAPPWRDRGLDEVPSAVREVLDDESPAVAAAERIGAASGLLCVGRGFAYAVALEAALKLQETTSILAQGYSSADVRHGPIAVVDAGVPVVMFRSGDAAADLAELTGELRGRGGDVIDVGPAGDLPVPAGVPDALTVFPAAVRAQQLAFHLAQWRGRDPDRPAGLHKVTPTT